MKPTTTNIQTVSTLSGAEVMGIDAKGMGTVLSILSNMYSDGALAVVREYASNALDSHVEAGNTDPILITSPTHFNPIFTVQDFGTGLSRDEVLNVYAKYGASTKRETDEQIGAFGIGAKSAFTVGTQFTVTAVRDGWQTIALFALNDNGAPTVNIIAHAETIEPNGVKVEVGVKDVDGVNRAIERLFRTWKQGTVMVDGIEPTPVWDELEQLDTDIHLGWRENNYSDTGAWTVVMGGVPYEVPREITRALEPRASQIAANVAMSLARVFLTVPIGAVDITPSREDLRDTPKTRTAISEMVTRFYGLLGPWITRQISSAPSRIGAMIEYRKLTKKTGGLSREVFRHVTWCGKPVTGEPIDYLTGAEWFELRNKRGNYYGEKVASREKTLRLKDSDPMERFLFVTGVPERRTRSVQIAAKPYLMAEANKDGKTGMIRVVALTEPLLSYAKDWFDVNDPALHQTDFDAFIKAWKPAPTPSQRGEVTYDVVYPHSDQVPASELRELDDVIYLTADEYKTIWNRYSTLRSQAFTGYTVVVLKPTQKTEVLRKRVPDAQDGYGVLTAAANEVIDNMTQTDYDMLAGETVLAQMDSSIMKFLDKNSAKITNQVVLKALGQYRKATGLNADASRKELLRVAAIVAHRDLAGKSNLDLASWHKINDGLPLLLRYFDRHWNRTSLGDSHVIDYVNSINL